MATDTDGFVYAALINKNMPDGGQFGFYVKYNKSELPEFTQWKMNGTREYVVGMEPANCRVEGRDKERERGHAAVPEAGRDTRVPPGDRRALDADEVTQFEELVESIRG